MKAASISEIRAELKELPAARLSEICLRLARYKKENKELLTFLLFEANDLPGYIKSVKEEVDREFASINKTHGYYAKKTLRKILRITNKYIRYSGSPIVETELLIHFCLQLDNSGINVKKTPVLNKLYENVLKKIREAIASLHEDLQYDYLKQLEL
jgi:hypothetical protein